MGNRRNSVARLTPTARAGHDRRGRADPARSPPPSGGLRRGVPGRAYLTVLALGLAVFAGAGAAADAVTGGVTWVRRIALGLAAVLLLVAAVRRLRSRHRGAVTLPSWWPRWAW